MTYQRLAYDDAATTAEMLHDAAAVGRELRLPLGCETAEHRRDPEPTRQAAPLVSDDLAEVAARLELHLG